MPFLSYKRAVQLRQVLKDTQAIVVTPEDEGYPELISRWSEACEKEAGAVVMATSSHEVALTVTFATVHYIPFVVQGGGYSTSGASSTHGGIVINLSAMRGATWAEVDQAAEREGLAVVGCTTSAAGVGGTTLGGGFGWLTGRHGLVIDNLISVRMVLSDGRVVNASVAEHPDLFWAVRGAGQSFGVATEFVLRAHRQRSPIFGGLLYLPIDQLNAVVKFANQFDEKATGDEGLFFGFTTRPPALLSTVIVALLFYNGPRAAAEAFFAPLLALGPIQNETHEMPYPEMNTILGQLAAPGARKRMSGTTISLPLEPQIVLEIYEDFDRIMQSYPRVEGSVVAFELLPYARVIQVPVGATAYANRGPYHNVATVFRWHDPELDAKITSLDRALVRKIRERAGVAGVAGHGVGLYANYAGHEANAQELFGDNLPRLQDLKKHYDPKNMFQKWHNLLIPTSPV
ncbi:uncharacterized protein N7496_005720 [Penicillium cataractarum]|uniref:FAD-binding PCMH-type domain-containing protein n=1 Tax=Penicillium cataractarum TaxID=2100454 RepID=A0A9W9VGA9_9EURO|nr:uncharacterized protein N7496_005720 [Penicillium cataractarum]KAJ5378311.1 hypothetical protein N7496_005720 [Penicillium cataractarum]